MKSWEVLEIAIPRGAAERVASLLHVSADYVRRWRREPLSEETAPNGTGQRSILDRTCDLIDAAFLVNPRSAALIPQHVNAHYQALASAHQRVGFGGNQERAKAAAELLREAAEAINSLNVEGATDNTLRELIELREACNRAIEKLEAELEMETVAPNRIRSLP